MFFLNLHPNHPFILFFAFSAKLPILSFILSKPDLAAVTTF